jgi:hypothetical protein
MLVPYVLKSVVLPFTLLVLTVPAAASQQIIPALRTDDQGQLHIAASDVMILNVSFRGLLNQLNLNVLVNQQLHLNATLQQREIQTLSQQVAALRQNVTNCACSNNSPRVKFNATTATQIKLVAGGGGTANEYFGGALAVTDGMLFVGAYQDNIGEPGLVYVFEKNSTGQYEQVSKLVASDGGAEDRFGFALAATDGIVVVGANLDDDKGSNSGSVYVFEKNKTGQYEQVSKLVASDGAEGDRFGYAVAATDGMVVAGAFADDETGSVYVLEKNMSTGQYQQVSKLVASDGAAGDKFGYTVAATGGMFHGMVVVGAYADDDKGWASGSVYVFEKNSTGQYEQVSKLVASDGVASDVFGFVLAATDSMVVVGAHRNDEKGSDSGSAYVFEKNSTGQYEQVSKLVASDGAADDQFGRTMAVTDGMVVVGARWDDDNGADSGSVYVFEKNSTGQYEQVNKLVASDGAAGDRFGFAVAATDGMVVVGAIGNDGKGSTYVFE